MSHMQNTFHHRNLQKTGGASYIVTLPKSWIEKQRLLEQKSVTLYEHSNGTLCLRKQDSHSTLTALISLENKNRQQIQRELVGAYIGGAKQIIVSSLLLDIENKQLVRQLMPKLTGFEIASESAREIVLQDSAAFTITAREHALKVSQLLVSMLEDTNTAILTGHKRLATDVINRDDEVDRITIAVSRQLNQFLTTLMNPLQDQSLHEACYYQNVAMRLERIADHIVRICMTFLKQKHSKQKITAKQAKLMSKLVAELQQVAQMISAVDVKIAHQLIDEYEQVVKNAFLQQRNQLDGPLAILIEDSLERIRSYIANVAEETINFGSTQMMINR